MLTERSRPHLAGVRVRLVSCRDRQIVLFSGCAFCPQPCSLHGWAGAAAGFLGLKVPTGPVVHKAAQPRRDTVFPQGAKADTVNT